MFIYWYDIHCMIEKEEKKQRVKRSGIGMNDEYDVYGDFDDLYEIEEKSS